MESQFHNPQSISAASVPGNNGFPAITSSPIESARIGEVKRETKETNVSVKINLDGNGVADSSTGIPFLDHMLDALLKALGERKGINRFGDFTAPLDEALIHVSVTTGSYDQDRPPLLFKYHRRTKGKREDKENNGSYT